MADQKLYFAIDDDQETVELFRVQPDGAVERVGSAEGGVAGISEPGSAPLDDLVAGAGQIISYDSLDELQMLEVAGELVLDGGLTQADEGSNVFLPTDLTQSELLADHELVEGYEVELSELLDFETLAERTPEGGGAAQPRAAETAETVDILGGEFPKSLTIVVDDDPGDTPVTI